MIKRGLCRVVEKAIAAALKACPESEDILRTHHGRVLGLSLNQGWSIVLSVESSGIRVLPEATSPITAQISGTMSDIVRVLVQGTTSFTGSGLVMMGDAVWAAEFVRDLSALTLDWESVLSVYTGPFVAQGMARGFSLLQRGVRTVPQTLQAQVHTFLQQESGILPIRTEIEDWIHQVRLLQFDVERLEARFRQLTLREGRVS